MVIIIICACAGSKKKKAKKAAESAVQTEKAVLAESKTETVAGKKVQHDVAQAESVNKVEVAATPVEPIHNEEVAETVAVEPETAEKAEAKSEETARHGNETLQKPKPTTAKKKSSAKTVARPAVRFSQTGTFEFTILNEKYHFRLYANNGQLLYESRPYASLATAKNAVNTFKKNIAEHELLVEVDKNGNYHWTFTKGTVVMDGISYDTKASAEANAQSVKNFSETAIIGDKVVDWD